MPRTFSDKNRKWAVYIERGIVQVQRISEPTMEGLFMVIRWFDGEDAEIQAKAFAYDFMLQTGLHNSLET